MSGWRTVALGDEVTLQRGVDITKETMKLGNVPVISSGGINGYHDTSIANGPGVLLGRKGSVGKVHYVETAYWPHDTTLWVKDFHGNYPRFVFHFFSQFPISRYEASTANPSLNRNNLHPVKVYWPPLAEQRRIAEELDRAEALRAKRRAALAQLDSLTQSLFLDLFGDPATNPKRWPLVRLGDQTTKIGSGSTPTGGETAYREEGISLIRSLNVRDGEFTFKDLAHIGDEQAAKLAGVVVEENDVLLNITGASVARVCHAPSSVLPARVNQHVCIIRPKPTLNAVFLEQFLLAEQTKRRLLKIGGAGATREAITKAQIEVFEAICPPIELQREFARRVTAVEVLKTAQRASLAELDALFATLQHRAFRGEL